MILAEARRRRRRRVTLGEVSQVPEMRGRRESGAGAPNGEVEGGKVGRDGAGAGGGDDRRLRLLEQPLDGGAVVLVAQLARELKDTGGAGRRHSDPTAAAVDLGVPVLGRGPLRRRLLGLLRRRLYAARASFFVAPIPLLQQLKWEIRSSVNAIHEEEEDDDGGVLSVGFTLLYFLSLDFCSLLSLYKSLFLYKLLPSLQFL